MEHTLDDTVNFGIIMHLDAYRGSVAVEMGVGLFLMRTYTCITSGEDTSFQFLSSLNLCILVSLF